MSQSRRLPLALAVGLCWCLSAQAGPGQAQRSPNVVLILADDLGWGDVGFNGRKEWATPHLDRLAAQGTTFRRFYTAGVTCAPSRGALLTGKATIHSGVTRNDQDLPLGQVTIAEALRARGYATALFGKWHRGRPKSGGEPGHPMDQGFDEFFGFTDAVHAWEQFPSELYDGRDRKPVTGYANDLFADHAVDFLNRHRAGAPFFLYLPFTATHFHIQAPADEVALHQRKFTEADPNKPLKATYAAMVTRLDRNVGRVLQALDDRKLADDTIVIFTSDHGATFERGNLGVSNALDSNHPFRGQKRTLWEGGIRVPGVVRWPGHVPSGVISDQIIQMTDVMPTLLAAAGSEPDPAWKLDGIDVLPAWTGVRPLPERTLFWEWRSEGANQSAAMRGRFKLVLTGDAPPELYDVEADPAERRNVIAEHAELAQDLRARIKAWLATESRD